MFFSKKLLIKSTQINTNKAEEKKWRGKLQWQKERILKAARETYSAEVKILIKMAAIQLTNKKAVKDGISRKRKKHSTEVVDWNHW